ncbi:uncharacterized protein TM35_000221200 [Trypanosoma theileri]|uniref:Ubiquitin-like domain-containing protein n=1 Tax=Trypanosoma theileri TaxID=67003 RepID=A0A1X0NRU4_9TRYP|nr:uncharacterized protein TM35_000221200 [Trypanosoma theileri]ORC87321.1 hypothetical protein TM35_000221200 [Trypanosoma theileri]
MGDVGDDFTDSAEEWEAPVNVTANEDDNKNNKNTNASNKSKELVEQLLGEDRELAGEMVRVVFHLPDGRSVTREHFTGETIACLKAQLEECDGLAYDKTTLFIGDRALLDPLSLDDLPFTVGVDNNVTVRITE